jgi:hypothetical protein
MVVRGIVQILFTMPKTLDNPVRRLYNNCVTLADPQYHTQLSHTKG